MRVFISHSSHDNEAVTALAAALRERGIDAWLDRWELRGGDDFIARINRALGEADAGLIVFSAAAAASRWVSAETSYWIWAAVEQGKKIIPVMAEDGAPIPPLIQPRLRRGIAEVDAIVEALLERSGGPPALGSAAAGKTQRVVVSLRRRGSADELGLRVEVRLGEQVYASESFAGLPAEVARGQELFRRGPRLGVRRDHALADRAAREAELADLGRALRDLCLPGAAPAALAELLDGAPAGVTVEVCFEADDAGLLGLPFETLRLADDRLLAVHPKVVVFRRPAGSTTPQKEHLAGPLKILVAVGAPDEDKSPNVVLDQERELQNLLDAVEEARRLENVEVRILEVGSPEQIGAALERDAYHVLHLSCHGAPGFLELEDEEGAAVRVTAKALMEPIVRQGRPLPMVFLNSCHGGALAGDAASLAEELLAAGIPCVLAMTTSVSDSYATRLAGLFYLHLARRDRPRASRALAAARFELEAARLAALAQGGADPAVCQPEAATPSLFVAGEEPALLDPSLAREPLRSRPVYEVSGPVPQLRVDELIGRRQILRETLKALRDPARRWAGVALTGIGGVGKSAVAGRMMQRLEEDGWKVAAHRGRIDLAAIAALVSQALLLAARPELRQLAKVLVDPELDELQRFGLAAKALSQERILLVLDDFEQNLNLDGSAFLDPDSAAFLGALVQNAHRGRLLITCRFPLPGFASALCEVPVGPLSDAETRKLLLRLDSLRGKKPEELRKVLKVIGNHPRMLELLDALLQGGQGRLAHLNRKLAELLAKAGIASVAESAELDEGLRQALLLGSRDVMLEELLEVARVEGTAEALLQLAVSNLPVSAAGLARMSTEDPLGDDAGDVAAAEKAIGRLARLSLVFRHPNGDAWVHRWTAEGLAGLSDKEDQNQRRLHAGRFRLWRVANESHDLGDAIEAVRNFLAGRHFDDATPVAKACFQALRRMRQSAGIAALAAEVLEFLPVDNGDYAFIADQEAQAHLALGWTRRAMDRYQALLALHQQRVAAEPERADYQRDLSVSYIKMGDLYRNLGEGQNARDAYLKALAIRERLAAAEPERADYQRDLSVSYNKMGDLHRDLGEGENARDAYRKALAIAEKLADAEPERADYQRDLSVSYNKMGDLYRDLGEGQNARDAYLKAVAIAERIVAAEPERADFQRDLSVCYIKMGDLYGDLGETQNSRDAYLKTLAITERLAASEPERADYQRDLAGSHERLGHTYEVDGNFAAAHEAFSRSLRTYEPLSAAEPERVDLQLDLWVPLTGLGRLEGLEGREKTERALAIVEGLEAEGRLPPSQRWRIDSARRMLAELSSEG